MTAFNIGDLRKQAEAGDPQAQYRLAATLASSGAAREADKWLRSAAKLGEPDAGYTLATRCLQTHQGAKEAAATLQGAAQNGSTAAKRLLGVLYREGLGIELDRRRALGLVIEAVKAGDPAAMRELAMLLLSKDDDDAAGGALLGRAAERDPVAAAVYVRRTIENRAFVDRMHARAALNMLTAMRYPNAPALSGQFAQNGVPEKSQPDKMNFDWEDLAGRLSDEAPERMLKSETLCAAPDAKIFRSAFTPEECEYVIAASAARLAPSYTTDPRTGASRQDAYRTSMTATLGPVDLDLVLVAFNRRVAGLAGRPHENGEFLSVLRYAPGQEYRPHFDWLPVGEDYDRGGQRVTTALVYLNDGYGGGETHFLSPDVKFKGRPGDLLVFHNAAPDGSPDKASRHASLPVSSGEKWICSKWFREKKYNF